MTIPEFVGASPAGQAGAAIACQKRGALILRQELSQNLLEHLRLLSTAVFSIFDMKVQDLARGEVRGDDPLVEHVKRYETLQFIGEDVVRTLLSHAYLPRAGFDRITEVLGARLKTMFPEKTFEFVPGKSALRRQGTNEHARKSAYVGWHRDSHAVQTDQLGNCLNCWVPFHAVGIERPSLQVVIASNQVLQNRPVDYAIRDDPSEEQVVADYGSESICTAVLDPGDVLIFGHHTLHRTQPMGISYPLRLSGEFRFASKD
jgi:hypothetical protein